MRCATSAAAGETLSADTGLDKRKVCYTGNGLWHTCSPPCN